MKTHLLESFTRLNQRRECLMAMHDQCYINGNYDKARTLEKEIQTVSDARDLVVDALLSDVKPTPET